MYVCVCVCVKKKKLEQQDENVQRWRKSLQRKFLLNYLQTLSVLLV